MTPVGQQGLQLSRTDNETHTADTAHTLTRHSSVFLTGKRVNGVKGGR